MTSDLILYEASPIAVPSPTLQLVTSRYEPHPSQPAEYPPTLCGRDARCGGCTIQRHNNPLPYLPIAFSPISDVTHHIPRPFVLSTRPPTLASPNKTRTRTPETPHISPITTATFTKIPRFHNGNKSPPCCRRDI